ACCDIILFSFFFLHGSAATEIYTLSLHDALPISVRLRGRSRCRGRGGVAAHRAAHPRRRRVHLGDGGRGLGHRQGGRRPDRVGRSEEHTSELQSRENLVCRLLLEKKKNNNK